MKSGKKLAEKNTASDTVGKLNNIWFVVNDVVWDYNVICYWYCCFLLNVIFVFFLEESSFLSFFLWWSFLISFLNLFLSFFLIAFSLTFENGIIIFEILRDDNWMRERAIWHWFFDSRGIRKFFWLFLLGTQNYNYH